MLKRFGPLQVFFTVSPDSAGTYAIGEISGVIPAEAVAQAALNLLPSRGDRRQIASNDPVACAQYFIRVIECVIDYVLGWDRSQGRARRGGGIFGVVRSFACATETQQAGDLHAHFVVWLHGFPHSGRKMRELIESNDRFKSNLEALAGVVSTTSIPTRGSPVQCVEPNCFGALEPVKPTVDAFRRPKLGCEPPVTSRCRDCGKRNRDKDVLDASISAASSSMGLELTAEYVDFLLCKDPEVDDQMNMVEVTLVLREVQVHFWTHTRSCFKITSRTPRGTVCRFFRPADVSEAQTFVDSSMDFIPTRLIGSEYVNGYNHVVLNTLKCNHDIRFILGCGSKNVAAYICKYCMKPQNKIENEVAFTVAAYGHGYASAERQSDGTQSQTEFGFKVLSSMLYALTNKQEVAGTLAAVYILRASPFWFSHAHVRVNFAAVFGALDDLEEEEITVSQNELSGLSLTRSTKLMQAYWNRPESLVNIPFLQFLELWEVQPRERGDTRYVMGKNAKVMVVSGKEIPEISTCTGEDDKTFFYRVMLTPFKPHRSLHGLHGDSTYAEAYASFVVDGDANYRSMMKKYGETISDYQEAAREERAGESEEEALLSSLGVEDEPWVEPPPDDTLMGDDVAEELLGVEIVEEEDPSAVFVAEDDTSRLAKADEIVASCPGMRDTIIAAACATAAQSDPCVQGVGHIDNYHSLIMNGEASSVCDGTSTFLDRFPTIETSVQKFADCFIPVKWTDALQVSASRDTLTDYPSIAEVSAAFGLNFWQHTAFEVMARHLLFDFLGDCASQESDLASLHKQSPYGMHGQLRGYLGGEAGTGKSRVIHAILEYAKRWGRSDAVETLAFTGVAAMNIEGRTIHSARNLSLNGRPQRTSPSSEMKMKYAKVRLVVVDEISMLDQSLLGALDQVSRAMAGDSSKYMGGKHVVLCGDWLQLPPVGGTKCFVVPRASDRELKHMGYNLYHAINVVIFLVENMRSRTDDRYATLLRRARWGSLTEEDARLLNTRAVNDASSFSYADFRPVVVSTNRLRSAINLCSLIAVAGRSGQSLYECRAVATRARSCEIVDKIQNVSDELTDRIPMRLLFFVGMPVMLTKKHPELKEANVVANGTIGNIVGFTDTTVSDYRTIGGVAVAVLGTLPQLLFVRVRGCSKQLVRGFPPGVIGIPPMTVQINLRKIPNLRRCTVTVKQFPMVPCYSSTTEKLQGQTCDEGIIVAPLERGVNRVPPQTLYVALSRTVSLAKLTLTQPVTQQYLQRFVPTDDVIQEMRRLQNCVQLPDESPVAVVAAFTQWLAAESVTVGKH